MSQTLRMAQRLGVVVAMATVCGLVLPERTLASGGATDVIPGTSKSGVKSGGSGGGGGGRPTTTPSVPAPAPAPQPIITAPLTFTPAVLLNGVAPSCIGSYRIDPYYPTLSLLTVSVQTSLMNVPDGSLFYITVTSTGGIMYPFTSNIIPVLGQAGTCSFSEYVTPGTVIQSVVITDASGTVIFQGK
jgi:hypothetical protein